MPPATTPSPAGTAQAAQWAIATDLAGRFLKAFARPTAGTTNDAWWATVQPYLTSQAAADYAGTDPANVPFTSVTGVGVVVPVDAPDSLVTMVQVPTDAGPYLVEIRFTPEGLKVSRASARVPYHRRFRAAPSRLRRRNRLSADTPARLASLERRVARMSALVAVLAVGLAIAVAWHFVPRPALDASRFMLRDSVGTWRGALMLREDGSPVIRLNDERSRARLYGVVTPDGRPRLRLLENASAFNADSFVIARHLLRAGDERPKPNGERLREYSDARKDSFEQQLFSDKPIHKDLEILTLGDSLSFFVSQLGADTPLVKTVLAGKSPRARASELINGSKVRDVAFRRKLYEGGAAAVAAAKDPLIELARVIDAEARALRKTSEAQAEIKQQAQAVIGKARFAIEGTSNYPDATFTLRLSYGPVLGYEEDGRKIPAFTTLAGLYARNAEQNNKEPFDLPPRWLKRKSAVKLDTPYNFVSTADIIGGNSGSPVVNKAGEFVGIIFDGNIQSLSGDYGYEDVQARALSVHSAGILETLRKIYEVPALANELVNGKR